MNQPTFKTQERLNGFPLVKAVYILYRRLVEQGTRTTYFWLTDKILQRIQGFSPPHISRIVPQLYVGGQPRRHGLQRMRELGIHASVNMREEYDDAPHGVALDHYLWLPTTDDDPPTIEDLEKGCNFIAAQISAGNGVYIHCAEGVGRAPTMAAAYLVSTGMTASQAWDAVCQMRPFVRPYPRQRAIIKSFARHWAQQEKEKP